MLIQYDTKIAISILKHYLSPFYQPYLPLLLVTNLCHNLMLNDFTWMGMNEKKKEVDGWREDEEGGDI